MKHLLISSPSNSSEDQIVIIMQESTATPTGLFHLYGNQNAALDAPSSSPPEWSAPIYVALALIFILGVITFVGNILIIVSVVKFKRLQIPPNFILVNLAVADLGVAVMTLLLFGFKFLRSTDEGSMVCLVPYCLMSLFSGVSVLNLSVVAYDRFSALVEPLKYSTRITTCHITVICMAVWIYMGLISTIPLITWNVTDQVQDRISSNTSCTISFYHSYTSLAQVIAVFLPAIVCMFFCYCRVMLVARYHTRAISAVKFSLSPGVLKTYNSSFKGSKYWRTLALILGVFTITWGTFTATVVIEVFCKRCADFLTMHNYSGLLLLLNSSLNPWIYAFRNKDFRAAFKRMVRCLRQPCKKKLARSNSSLVSERRNSHMSIALSRTNSLCGNLQAMQMLYEQEMALKNNNQPSYKDSEVHVETAQTSVNNSKLSVGKDIEGDPESPTPPTPSPQQKVEEMV